MGTPTASPLGFLQRAQVFLLGPDTAANSTVGRLVASSLNRPFIGGLTTADLEATLRGSAPAVIAVSGGIADETTLRRLAEAGQVVVLVGPDIDAARASGAGQVDSRLLKAVAEVTVEVDGQPPGDVARRVLDGLLHRVRVELGDRAYDVVVGPGAVRLVNDLLPARARRAAVVTQAAVPVTLELGIESVLLEIPDGEKAKSLATIEHLCREFSRAGLTRADVVIGLGGGVVTDTAGFAASCYHRGIAEVNVSTTLLGQVDAAIGGKTGVNLPEGKNLVGAFWQPSAVICDTDTLATLQARELGSGQGEMAKYAFLGVEDLEALSLVHQVSRCVALKAEVVAEDEREGARRAVLNYGHTLAHALEATGFAEAEHPGSVDLRHGEAVGIGLVFAARLACALGRIDAGRVARHIEVVSAYGLSIEIPAGVDTEEVLAFMTRDKKATDGLTFVLDGPGGVETVAGVPSETVRKILRSDPA